MAELSFPHADYPTAGAGAVSEAEYATWIGWASPSGLIGTPGDLAPLFLSGGALWLRAGTAARLVGVAYANADDDLPVTIGANAGTGTRLDHVVLRLSWSTMLVRHAVIPGVPGGTLPALTQHRATGVYEISLGQVAVPAGGSVATATLTRLGWYLSPDGQIWCTAATRPPHTPGRRIWQTDGRGYVSTGSEWRLAVDEAGPTAAGMQPGFAASHNTLWRRNGLVTMELSFTRPAAGMGVSTSYHVATLPVGYRPRGLIQSAGQCPSGQSVVTSSVDTDGRVHVNPGATGINPNRTVVLSAITFPVAV